MQDSLLEHKFPCEKAQIMDTCISYAGDIYREMAGGVYQHEPHFGYVYEKWVNLTGLKLTEGDWEEIKEQLFTRDYEARRDLFLGNLQKVRKATEERFMDAKRKEVMLSALIMIDALISWFDSLNPHARPAYQLDMLTGAIGSYFPQFWTD
jgi:hypothetical protein